MERHAIDPTNAQQIEACQQEIINMGNRIEEARQEADRRIAMFNEVLVVSNSRIARLAREDSVSDDDAVLLRQTLAEMHRASNFRSDARDEVLALQQSRIRLTRRLQSLGQSPPLALLQDQQSVDLGLNYVEGEQPDTALIAARNAYWSFTLFRQQVEIRIKQVTLISERLGSWQSYLASHEWYAPEDANLDLMCRRWKNVGISFEQELQADIEALTQAGAEVKQCVAAIKRTSTAQGTTQEGDPTSNQLVTPENDGNRQDVVSAVIENLLKVVPQKRLDLLWAAPRRSRPRQFLPVRYLDLLIEGMADKINLKEARRCLGTLHVLNCRHQVRTDTELCSTQCKNPKRRGSQASTLRAESPYCHRCMLTYKDLALLSAIRMFEAYQEKSIASENSQYRLSQLVEVLDAEKTVFFGALRRTLRHPRWDRYEVESMAGKECTEGIRRALYAGAKSDIRECLKEAMEEANIYHRLNRMLELALKNAEGYTTDELKRSDQMLPKLLKDFKKRHLEQGWYILETVVEMCLDYYKEKWVKDGIVSEDHLVTLDNLTVPQLLVLDCIIKRVRVNDNRETLFFTWDGYPGDDPELALDKNGAPVPDQPSVGERMAKNFLEKWAWYRTLQARHDRRRQHRQALDIPIPVSLYADDQAEDYEHNEDLPDPVGRLFGLMLERIELLNRVSPLHLAPLYPVVAQVTSGQVIYQ